MFFPREFPVAAKFLDNPFLGLDHPIFRREISGCFTPVFSLCTLLGRSGWFGTAPMTAIPLTEYRMSADQVLFVQDE